MTALTFFTVRTGFRETLMVQDGEIEREATTEEEHEAWASQCNSFDALAQRADDMASEGFR